VKEHDKNEFYKQLSWNDLEDWTGTKIVSRGRSYQNSGRVEGLVHTEEGGLIAWVQGKEQYATWIDIEQGKLISGCTCPYWDTCKHAVAVVLEYLETLKEGFQIPSVTHDDRRLFLLRGFRDQGITIPKSGTYSQANADLLARLQYEEKTASEMLAYLEQQPKEQLIKMLLELQDHISGAYEFLKDQRDLEMGRSDEIIARTRNEIYEISSEPGWRNEWTGEGFTPDYSQVRHRLEALLAYGYADEVVGLGEDLLEVGTKQVGMSEDGGETAVTIAECLDIVFRALPQSTLSPAEQLIWSVEADLNDDHDLCDGAELFWDQEFDVADWNTLADRLDQRLDADQAALEESSHRKKYHRDRLTDWLVIALDGSDRDEEIIPLLEREAVCTDSYLRLVAYLIEAKSWIQAEEWIQRGIEATESRHSGIASHLRDKLRVIRENEGDWLSAASLRAEEFFRRTSLETYQKLQTASERAGVWQAVRAGTLRYLETGEIPSLDGQAVEIGSIPQWPLSEIGGDTVSSRRKLVFPLTESLIDISIAENCVDDVVKWYEKRNSEKGLRMIVALRDDKIAQAVVEAYPELAIVIWKGIAEAKIAQTQTKAYEVAARYLRKIYHVLEKQGRDGEWHRYLAEIRETNKRKRRLLEILDGLIGRPIIDG